MFGFIVWLFMGHIVSSFILGVLCSIFGETITKGTAKALFAMMCATGIWFFSGLTTGIADPVVWLMAFVPLWIFTMIWWRNW